MTSTLSIIKVREKHMVTYIGSLDELTSMLTSVALRDEDMAEAITRAAVAIDIKKQVDRQLIEMTQG